MDACIKTIERLGFLIFPFPIRFDSLARIYRKCYLRLLFNLGWSIGIFYIFIFFAIKGIYVMDANVWYWFDILRQTLWAATSLVFFTTSMTKQQKTVTAFNHILKLPCNMNLTPLKRCLDCSLCASLLYQGPFLFTIYFIVFDLKFAVIDYADFMTAIAYNSTTLMITFWCLLQIVVLHYLDSQLWLTKKKLEIKILHEYLGEFDAALSTSRKYVKSIERIIPWLLLFSSVVFVGVLFFTDFFVQHDKWTLRLRVYVFLADIPLTLIFYVFIRISCIWKTVSELLSIHLDILT